MTPLRFLVLAAALSFGALLSSGEAQAQRRAAATRTATAPKAAKGSKQALVKQFGVKPHANIKRRIGEKPLLHITHTKGAKYEKHLDHSVELIFKPLGSTGHSYMRVGRKIYDFAFTARANDFRSPTGNAYGFLMAATPEKIQRLQDGFNQLMSRNPNFSMTGTGHNNTFSCAGFISYVLKNHAPELGVSLTPSAVGIANRMMRGQAEAVTIYGGDAAAIANGSFEFKGL